MARIHAPPKQSGYLAAIEFQDTLDDEGRPDWVMLYAPGPKARAEYRAFTRRGGPVPAMAGELVREYGEERIRAQLEHLDWRLEMKPGKVADPAAWLVAAIRNGHAAP